jgi:acetyl-CoA C-acetyltransferase
VDDVIIGCSTQAGHQGRCIARMSALDAGWSPNASGVTLDRFCGSGITSVGMAANSIIAGMEDLVVAGGVEMMSYTGQLGAAGALAYIDGGNLHLRAQHPMSNVGIGADVIAHEEGISRLELDAYSFQSQQRAAEAIAAGRFHRSLVPIFHDDGRLALDTEQYPRPHTTMEELAQLKPAFAGLMDKPIDSTGTTYRDLVQQRWPGLVFEHLHHAGSSSGVVDGAAGLVLASPNYARANGLTPRAKVRTIVNSGGSPAHILNQPGPAARKALQRCGMATSDIDLFEINEAFAVVALKFIRDLALDPAKVNVNGGAIALGHPIGATGAMLIGTLLDELERQDKTVGMVTMCAAGGMAPAIIIERI